MPFPKAADLRVISYRLAAVLERVCGRGVRHVLIVYEGRDGGVCSFHATGDIGRVSDILESCAMKARLMKAQHDPSARYPHDG